MGVTRKILSLSTIGLIDFRSDKERIARSTRLTYREMQYQNRLLSGQYPPAPASAISPNRLVESQRRHRQLPVAQRPLSSLTMREAWERPMYRRTVLTIAWTIAVLMSGSAPILLVATVPLAIYCGFRAYQRHVTKTTKLVDPPTQPIQIGRV